MRSLLLLLAFTAACTDNTTDDTDMGTDVDTDTDTDSDTATTQVPATYTFTSRNGTDSSVSYSGQVFRHLLITDMKAELGDLTGRIDGGTYFPTAGDITTDLEFYLEFEGSVGGVVAHQFSSDPTPAQTLYNDVSSGKNLLGKIAGNDATGQTANWLTDLVGWEAGDVSTPTSLVRLWIDQIDDLAVDRVAGTIPTWPGTTTPIGSVYITAEGQDLRQLLQKFLTGAIAYSQGQTTTSTTILRARASCRTTPRW